MKSETPKEPLKNVAQRTLHRHDLPECATPANYRMGGTTVRINRRNPNAKWVTIGTTYGDQRGGKFNGC